MEINSGHSNVQIAIAVQPQAAAPEKRVEYDFVDETPAPATAVSQAPSLNSNGQEVGGIINTWA